MRKIIIKYGLIGSLISIFLTVLVYVMANMPIVSGFLQILTIVNLVFIGLYAIREFRKGNDGRVDLKSGFLTSFFSLCVILIISTLFSQLLFNYIDPSYRENQKNAAIENIQNNENIPEEKKQQIIERIEKQTKVTHTKELIVFGVSIALVGLISLIIAASVKKDMNETTQF